MRLGIDLDGVVADFNTGWMRLYNAEFGTTLTPADVVGWDQMVDLTHFGDIDEFWKWAERAGLDGSSVFRHLPVMPGAVRTLRQLSLEHRLVVVSTKPAWAFADTLSWIGELRVAFAEVHFVDDKTSVGCDAYLEDAPHQLTALVAARPEATVFRFVRTWNRDVPGTVPVRDWSEFADKVSHLALRSQP